MCLGMKKFVTLFAPGGHPKYSVMQACVLLKVSVSCHQVPDPKTATGPMFVNLLPLFFYFLKPSYGGKNISTCEHSLKSEELELPVSLILIRPSKSRDGRSRTCQTITPLQQ